MNNLTFNMSPVQAALVLELLKPYAELSLSLTAQYKMQSQNQQTNQNAVPSKTARAEKIKKED